MDCRFELCGLHCMQRIIPYCRAVDFVVTQTPKQYSSKKTNGTPDATSECLPHRMTLDTFCMYISTYFMKDHTHPLLSKIWNISLVPRLSLIVSYAQLLLFVQQRGRAWAALIMCRHWWWWVQYPICTCPHMGVQRTRKKSKSDRLMVKTTSYVLMPHTHGSQAVIVSWLTLSFLYSRARGIKNVSWLSWPAIKPSMEHPNNTSQCFFEFAFYWT